MALSSTEPADFPLARTALELGFDLIALRAPCKREGIRTARSVQERSQSESCKLRELLVAALDETQFCPFGRIALVHLRLPSIDQGVQAFLWAGFYFVLLWVGMLALEVSSATALILSLVAAGAIFLFVRLRGA